jgi:acetamidase/formamidase
MTRHFDAKGYDATTGIAPDLMEAAHGATRGMIDLLSYRHGMVPVDAYMLDHCRDRETDTYVGIGPSPDLSALAPREAG